MTACKTDLYKNPSRFLGRVILILLLIAGYIFHIPPSIAHAQDTSPNPIVTLADVDMREYPTVRASLRLSHPGTEFSRTLTLDQVTVMENNESIPLKDLRAQYQGVQFALAVNPSISLTLRDQEGFSNYSKMIAALKTIAPAFVSGAGDRFNLFINPDIRQINLDGYDTWLAALNDYQANMRDIKSSLNSLDSAVNVLSNDKSGQDRVLVYMTGYINVQYLSQLNAILDKAAKADIPVHIWMVMDAAVKNTPYTQELDATLQSFGGSLFQFADREAMPNPRDYLSGLGYTYTLAYDSQVRSSGDFELSAKVTSQRANTFVSDPVTFTLNVQPPRLDFINPVSELTIDLGANGSLNPDALPIEVAIEFPDSHPRGLVYSSLWVNDKLIQTNTQAPYGSFVLTLADYQQTQTLELEIRLKDELGLEGTTPLETIALTFNRPASLSSGAWYKSPFFIAALAALLLLAIGLAFIPKRKKPLVQGQGNLAETASQSSENEQKKAETVPEKILASLVKLDQDGTPSAQKPIPITRELTLIGRDKALSQIVLDDPTLEPMHAQLHVYPDGSVRLSDFNTIAGTYINYKPISSQGSSLMHGDIVHFGSQKFRFNSGSRIINPSISSEKGESLPKSRSR